MAQIQGSISLRDILSYEFMKFELDALKMF